LFTIDFNLTLVKIDLNLIIFDKTMTYENRTKRFEEGTAGKIIYPPYQKVNS